MKNDKKMQLKNPAIRACAIKSLWLLLIALYILLPGTAAAAEITAEDNTSGSDHQDSSLDSQMTGLYEGGELHAFYPSNAVFSTQLQQYIDTVDSLSFAWSRIDAEDPGNLNVTEGKNGNTFYYPKDYLLPVKYAKSKGKSIQLSIYVSGSDSTQLLPYEDKRKEMLEAILASMQTDISQGEEIYYDGVVIDIEGLRDTDITKTPLLYEGKQISEYYTQFLSELKQQLEPLGKKLYVAVNSSLYYDGYKYKEILETVDRVILMAHDYEPLERLTKEQVEQYTGYNALEPISSPAPILLVRQALDEISRDVEASDLSKVWLQITFDSAQWQFNVSNADGWKSLDKSTLSNKGRVTPLYKAIKARFDNQDGYGTNITYGYNNELQSPYLQYYNTKDKTWNVLLYEDSNSIGAKLDLAMDYGLGGISVWSLGNVPDYNDTNGKKYHLDGWSSILSKLSLPHTESADDKKQVSFVDKAVEQAVREKLDKTTGKLTVSDLKGIYRLKLLPGVKSLFDLKYLINLEYLDAQQLNLKDISAIAQLTKLRVLYLQRNQITDLNPLKKLTLLQVLSLNGNMVSSIQSLAALTKLQELYLKENQIVSIAALSKMVNLQCLSLDKNRISDLKPLAGLANLTELYIPENKIGSIASLKGLKNLQVLSLNRNTVSDLGPLAKLNSLEKLYIKNNKIVSLKPLKGLLYLNELYLAGNQVTDYRPISQMYQNPGFQCDFTIK